MLITQHTLLTLHLLKKDHAGSRTPWAVSYASFVARWMIAMRR